LELVKVVVANCEVPLFEVEELLVGVVMLVERQHIGIGLGRLMNGVMISLKLSEVMPTRLVLNSLKMWMGVLKLAGLVVVGLFSGELHKAFKCLAFVVVESPMRLLFLF